MSYVDEFYDNIHQLINASNSEELYKLLVTQALDVISAHSGAIFTVEKDGFIRKYSTEKKRMIPRKRGFTAEVLNKNESKILMEKEVSVIHPDQICEGFKSFIILPIFYKNHKYGVFYFNSRKPNYFNNGHIEKLNNYRRNAYFLLRNFDQFNRMNKAVEDREIFLSLASHEVKTPLSVVKLYSDLLCKKIAKKQIPDIKTIQSLSQGVDRLISVMNEYLGVDQSLSAKIQCFKRKVDLRSIIERSIFEASLTYPQHKFEFENKITQPIFTNIDNGKIMQVFINVLNNAGKYSKEHSAITVTLKKTGSNITTIIADEGSGIGKRDLAKVFNRFYRGRNAREKEGMGLGLYIAKNIIKAHGGDIQISSSFNHGTQVAIILPYDRD